MNKSEITSVGWLNNWSGSICLTICIKMQNQPIFVTISKEEFEKSGGRAGFNENKERAIEYLNKYGAGRPA